MKSLEEVQVEEVQATFPPIKASKISKRLEISENQLEKLREKYNCITFTVVHVVPWPTKFIYWHVEGMRDISATDRVDTHWVLLSFAWNRRVMLPKGKFQIKRGSCVLVSFVGLSSAQFSGMFSEHFSGAWEVWQGRGKGMSVAFLGVAMAGPWVQIPPLFTPTGLLFILGSG